MVSFIKQGKAVVILNGRFAGKKAVVVENFDEKTGDKKRAGHCLVVGVERCPLKITSSMGQKRVARRSRVKPFVKVINHSHMLPTRYSFNVDLSKVVKHEAIQDAAQRQEVRKKVRKILEDAYATGSHKWFFSKLRF
ncbi:putative 60S ribosomal protein L27 [Rozella allomycis CSF55]|uniref:Putative 60S ribosomal protein L27 n=1 Tax=Rozella allomycis (strain CSF55) TaxID=988480 RepID=A0A075AZ31_ROZAC|nr:Ribosomal protein L27e domain-containing protein [Rozella allomycis CSF55]RKP21782.1 putative 60S ribosomal protein L27 [Rozella allomycis CSF55]|eukprot:EPZ35389.1 Ribosomal protein L27e domain-containing protein [Rozella allomycis CSF55]